MTSNETGDDQAAPEDATQVQGWRRMRTVRATRRVSTDARAISTRSTIATALTTLSQSGRSVSVSALVREAGISRATFYTHFADLDEVILLIHETMISEVAAWQQGALSGPESWTEPDAQRESFRRFAVYVDKHRDLYAAIFDLPIGSTVRHRSVQVIADALRDRLDEVAHPPPGIRAEVVTSSLAAAYMHILSRWVQGDLELTVDEVMAHFVELMPDWLVDPAPATG